MQRARAVHRRAKPASWRPIDPLCFVLLTGQRVDAWHFGMQFDPAGSPASLAKTELLPKPEPVALPMQYGRSAETLRSLSAVGLRVPHGKATEDLSMWTVTRASLLRMQQDALLDGLAPPSDCVMPGLIRNQAAAGLCFTRHRAWALVSALLGCTSRTVP